MKLKDIKSNGLVGDMKDLREMVRWAERSGFKILQLTEHIHHSLLFDKTKGFFSPDNVFSHFAFSPLYLSIDLLIEQGVEERWIKDGEDLSAVHKRRLTAINKENGLRRSVKLSRVGTLTFDDQQQRMQKIYDFKIEFIQAIFSRWLSSASPEQHQKFSLFNQDQSYWADEYNREALIKHQDPTTESRHLKLPDSKSSMSAILMKKYASTQIQHDAEDELVSLTRRLGLDEDLVQGSEEADKFFVFVQFCIFNQLQAIVEEAEKRKVVLQYDLLSVVTPNSLDYSRGQKREENGLALPIVVSDETWWKNRMQWLNRSFQAYQIERVTTVVESHGTGLLDHIIKQAGLSFFFFFFFLILILI